MKDESQIKNISQLVEALLFWAAEPVPKAELQKKVGTFINSEVTEEDLALALADMESRLSAIGSAIRATVSEQDVELRLSSDVSDFISSLESGERDRDLGKAGLETLAIILYENGASRRRIEHVRGVNAQFTLRSLLMRGLIAKTEKEGERGARYIATPETFAFLGISSAADLPEFTAIKEKLNAVSDKE
ncbi:MAG TPA: SMC-Scp complex subunit ScpB [Candidatus Paceibacterota bacterium]|nr:SMC-Scp complex subunit ScpB [Candidatus Paceibacterota bacterium]